jgi:hypothetical protein
MIQSTGNGDQKNSHGRLTQLDGFHLSNILRLFCC